MLKKTLAALSGACHRPYIDRPRLGEVRCSLTEMVSKLDVTMRKWQNCRCYIAY